MINSIVKKIPLIIFCVLALFNFFLKLYLNKLINKQISLVRCKKNVYLISKNIKSISLILKVSTFIQFLLTILYISSNDDLRNKIFQFLGKLDNISMVKYILYISIFVLYILMLSPINDIDKICKEIFGNNTFYVIVNWLCISIMIILSLIIVTKKFISMKNQRKYEDNEDFLNFNFN